MRDIKSKIRMEKYEKRNKEGKIRGKKSKREKRNKIHLEKKKHKVLISMAHKRPISS